MRPFKHLLQLCKENVDLQLNVRRVCVLRRNVNLSDFGGGREKVDEKGKGTHNTAEKIYVACDHTARTV